MYCHHSRYSVLELLLIVFHNIITFLLDPPSQITDLTILSYTNISVKLGWTNSICITNYTIKYASSDGVYDITVSQSSYNLTILHKTMYNISVAATDTGGRTGPYSESICVLLDSKYYDLCP